MRERMAAASRSAMGFSLVELSIVLVLLALLFGGVLVGRSLIRASELRGIIRQADQYTTAAYNFRDKYLAVPGDLTSATKIWGLENGIANCLTRSSAAVTANGTCDGDGDGMLSDAWAANAASERFQFWRQLALAGFIGGEYTGASDSSGAFGATIGENVPASSIKNAGWYAESLGEFLGDGGGSIGATYRRNYSSASLGFGAQRASWNPFNPALTPAEAWKIDTKLDDGKPATGRVVGVWWNDTCASADDGSSADDDLVAHYRIEDDSIQCSLKFVDYF